MTQAFTAAELATRLGMTANQITELIRRGVIECGSKHWPTPIIGVDAAAEFCLAVGLNLGRLK